MEWADEVGVMFFMLWLCHYLYVTYIETVTLQLILMVIYLIMVGFHVIHRGDPIKRTVGVLFSSLLLLAQGYIALTYDNWYA